LVPDTLGQLTSDHGWNTIEHKNYLIDIISVFKKVGIRVSIFVDPILEMVEAAALTNTDRIELYTEAYAKHFTQNKEQAILPYIQAAKKANQLNIGINAGHDLDLNNLAFFAKEINNLKEVSIGHALICDSLYMGFQNTIQLYKRQLQ
jgi:pyridoxine 5-phosphate synthase